MSISAAGSGRSEQSLMFHIFRDFFLLSIAVAAVGMTLLKATMQQVTEPGQQML